MGLGHTVTPCSLISHTPLNHQILGERFNSVGANGNMRALITSSTDARPTFSMNYIVKMNEHEYPKNLQKIPEMPTRWCPVR